MDAFTAIRQRRSIKKFDPRHVLTEGEIRRLMEATALTPTSFNLQNYRFVVITDPHLKAEFRTIGWNQAQFSDCSLLVLICGDRMAYARDPRRYYANAPQQTQDAVVAMIRRAYEGRDLLCRDENFRSGSLAAMTLMLAAKAMGYDTCPMIGFDFAAAAALVNLPADHDIIMAVAVGKALAPARPRSGPLPLEELVIRDRFPRNS